MELEEFTVHTPYSPGRALEDIPAIRYAQDIFLKSAMSLSQAIDVDFRSGVELGVGASNLILSLLPDKLISVAEIFGYRGNREEGLRMLMGVGGWERGKSEPSVGVGGFFRWILQFT